jgi:hypothetical protein
MEPTSSPDNTRPSHGLARFWQVRPEPEVTSPGEEPPATPADLLNGSPLGTFRSRPIPPLAPIASAARHPGGAADPFGLNRAAARSGPRNHPAGNRPASGPPAPERHGDTDHSVPPDDETEPAQDVKSEDAFGGFGLGGRTGRFLFGGRDGDEPEATDSEDDASPAGESQVGDEPTDEETAGATSADEPADETPPDAGHEAAEVAGPSDENGREDMNGRAGAPGYAQTGEAHPDGTGEPVDESPGPIPADPPRAAAGWASVPGMTQPVSAGPVSGAPVSPAYPPNPYSVADFTPDHPAANLQPVSGMPGHAPEPADPATPAPVSPAQAPSAPVSASASVQIPASRTPPDLTIDLGEPGEGGGYAGLPQAAEGGYGFAPTGYSLGRPAEAFGVASVTPAAPQAGTVTPPPPEFLTFPPAPPARRAREEAAEEVPAPAVRRSASLEDVEPVRRGGRRAAATGETAPADSGDEPVIGRTVWDEDAARHFRAAWHEVKAEFVDDPVTALTRAHDLLTDAVNELTEVLLAERDELDPLRGTDTPDTESMRMAMRGYREFLERILSL